MAGFEKRFNITVQGNMDVSGVLQGVDKIKAALGKIQLPDTVRQSFVKLFDNFEREANAFAAQTSQDLQSMGDVNKLEKSFSRLENLYAQIQEKVNNTDFEKFGAVFTSEELQEFNALKAKVDEATSAFHVLEQQVNDLKDTLRSTNFTGKGLNDLKNQLIEAIASGEDYTDILAQMRAAMKDSSNYAGMSDAIKSAESDLRKYTKGLDVAQVKLSNYNDQLAEQSAKKISIELDISTLESQLAEAKEKIARVTSNLATAAPKQRGGYTVALNRANARALDIQGQLDVKQSQLTDTEKKIKSLNAEIDRLNMKDISLNEKGIQTANEKLNEAIQNVQKLDNASLKGLEESFDGLARAGQNANQAQDRVDKLEQELSQVNQELDALKAEKIKDIGDEAKAGADGVESLGNSLKEVTAQAEQMNSINNQIGNIYGNLLRFFSLENGIQLFKKAVNGAFSAVKELDAAMTEIAVVSDYSIDDMWAQLPRFTEEANKLGVSIKDVYNATTLYVQQGLDLNQSMELSIETLKMARVAGMEASAATDAMTAALRGFNMELNQTSGQRINDVYSELAAITASDTQEIATAMSKVASLAHSANMEFETTAAMLAQGVEITREAPETIGTALKTIIARFGEIKKLYTEGQILGTDSEGEEINVNKIQAALRSVGISMTDFLVGNEGLDQVLLRLSEKWNNLTVVQQRYIATMAAGSRQQSRFIAMLQDNARLTDLIGAAYNSAGSGQKQYEKTLDSLESKLTLLKNAWDRFVTGIVNSDFIKAVIDFATNVLQALNDVTDKADALGTAFLRVITIIGGLKLGKGIVTGLGGILTKILQINNAGKGLKGINITNLLKGLDATTLSSFVSDSFGRRSNAHLFASAEAEGLSLWQSLRLGFMTGSKTNPLENGITGIFKNSFSKIKRTISSIGIAIGQAFGNPVTLAIMASVAAIALVIKGINDYKKAVYNASVEGRIEQLAGAIEGLQEKQEALKQELEDSNKAFDTYKDLKEELSSIAENTDEWRKKQEEVNTAIRELISLYPGLEKYAEFSANGYTGITEEGLAEIERQNREKYNQIADTNLSANILAVQKQQLQTRSKITDKDNNNQIEALNTISTQINDLITKGIPLPDDFFKKLTSLESYKNNSDFRIAIDNLKPELEKANDALTVFKTTSSNSLKEKSQWINAKNNLNQNQEWNDFVNNQEQNFKNGYISNNVLTKSPLNNSAAFGAFASQMASEQKKYDEIIRDSKREQKSLVTFAGQEYWNDIYKSSAYDDLNETIKQALYQEYLSDFEKAANDALKRGNSYGLLSDFRQDIPYFTTLTGQNLYTTEDLNSIFKQYGISSENSNFFEFDKKGKYNSDYFSNSIFVDKSSDDLEFMKDALAEILVRRNNLDISDERYNTRDKVLESFLGDTGGLTVESTGQLIKTISGIDATIKEANLAEIYGTEKPQFLKSLNNEQNLLGLLGLNVKQENINITDLLSFDLDAAKQEYSKLSEKYGEETKNAVDGIFGIAEDSLDSGTNALQKLFDKKVTEVAKNMVPQYKNLVTQFIKGSTKFYGEEGLAATNVYDAETGTFDVNAITGLVSQINPKLVSQLEEITTQLGGTDFEGISSLLIQIAAVNPEGFSKFIESLGDKSLIDVLSNEEDKLKLVQTLAATGISDLAALSNAIVDVNTTVTNAGEDLVAILNSEDDEFVKITEAIQDLQRSSEKIDSDDIQKLCDKYEDFDKIVKKSGISLKAWAKILNNIDDNDALSGLTERVAELLQNFDSFSDKMEGLHNFISEFNPGLDYGEGIDWIGKTKETLDEFAKNYEFANEQFINYFSAIFGRDTYEQMAAQMQKAGSAAEVTKIYNAYSQLMAAMSDDSGRAWWQQTLSGDNLKALRNEIDGFSAEVSKNGTKMSMDIANATTEQLAQALAKVRGISEEAAMMMIQSWASKDLVLKANLDTNDLKAQIADITKTISAEGDFFGEKEIQVLAASMGMETEELIKKLEKQNPEVRTKIVTFYDDGQIKKSSEGLLDEVKKISSVWSEDYLKLDIPSLQDELAKKGYTAEEITRILQEVFAAAQNEGIEVGTYIKSLEETTDKNGANVIKLKSEWVSGESPEALLKAQEEANNEFKVDLAFSSDALTSLEASIVESIQSVLAGTFEASITANVTQNNIQSDIDTKKYYASVILKVTNKKALTDLTGKTHTISFKAVMESVVSGVSNLGKTIAGKIGSITGKKPNVSPSYASGSDGVTGAQTALVGEEGPEIILRDGEAEIAGTTGPEYVHLNKGDQVWDAETTKGVLNRSGKKVPRYAKGTTTIPRYGTTYWTDTSSKGNSSKSSSDSDKDPYESNLDLFINFIKNLEYLNDRLSDLIDERDHILQRRTEAIEVGNLSEVIKAQEDLARIDEKIKSQYDDIIAENMAYATDLKRELGALQDAINSFGGVLESSNGRLFIHWDAYNALGDEAKEKVDDLISKWEDYYDRVKECKDQIKEVAKYYDNLAKEYRQAHRDARDDFIQLIEDLAQALEEADQKELDNRQEYYDELKKKDDDYLDALRKNVEKRRHLRDKADSYSDLASKQARLSLLQRDSSGVYANEIASLQKEIAGMQQDLADTEIDDILDKMQEDYDDQHAFYERQITLMTDVIKELKENGEYNQRAEDLLRNNPEEAIRLLTEANPEYLSLSETQREKRLEEINSNMIEMTNYLSKYYTNLVDQMTQLAEAAMAQYQALNNMATTLAGGGRGNYDTTLKGDTSSGGSSGSSGSGGKTSSQNSSAPGSSKNNPKVVYVYYYTWQGKKYAAAGSQNKSTAYNNAVTMINKKGESWAAEQIKAGKKSNLVYKQVQTMMNSAIKTIATKNGTPYKEGGIVDYTGIAQVHGSPKKPEVFLDAEDTKNFSTLKELLGMVLDNRGATGVSSRYQDYQCGDCNINVTIEGGIASDYDVERAIDVIKREIVSSSNYRNINLLNRRR